jgi:hypothetical protein
MKVTTNYKYIATGTGRCGTAYLARVLSSVSIPCGHECVFDFQEWYPGITCLEFIENKIQSNALKNSKFATTQEDDWLSSDTTIQAESSYMSAPFLNHRIIKNATIIHLIRNLLQVIRSFVLDIHHFSEVKNYGKEGFIYSILPELKQNLTPYERAALFYVKWNEMIEHSSRNRNYLLHRIEDPISNVLELIDCPKSQVYNNRLSNTRKKHDDILLGQIKSKEIRQKLTQKAEQYEYRVHLFATLVDIRNSWLPWVDKAINSYNHLGLPIAPSAKVPFGY